MKFLVIFIFGSVKIYLILFLKGVVLFDTVTLQMSSQQENFWRALGNRKHSLLIIVILLAGFSFTKTVIYGSKDY